MAAVDPRDAGAASGVRSTASQLGGAVGVVLVGLVFYGALPQGRALAATPGDGYTHALSIGLWYVLAVALFSALAMMLLPKRPRARQHDEAVGSLSSSKPPNEELAEIPAAAGVR